MAALAFLHICRLARQWRRLWRRCDGNVAITFAFGLIPILSFVGTAVDYSRANTLKTQFQAALDSTALMVAKSAATMTHEELQTAAQKYLTALLDKPYARDIQISATYSSVNGSTVKIDGSVKIDTVFLDMFGIHTVTIGTSATAKWGSTRLRVALVLDNTGSMASDGKMTALKTATKNLLGQLKDAVTVNGDVYVSIIPFAKDVNLGAANYTASWIDWTEWEQKNGSCNAGHKYKTKSSCNSAGGVWTPDDHDEWTGCVVDRGNSGGPSPDNYDTNVVPPTTAITATLFAAEQYSSCPQAATELSYDWNAMATLVDNMTPSGNTNQAIGLAVGWMSLVGGGPFFAPAKDPYYQYQDVIILFTDGLNTQNRWSSSQWAIDARQQMTCNNAKAAGVVLYTIQVNTGGDPTSTLLRNCASGPDKFFLLTTADQIVATFNAIGTNLSRLRVAQ